MRKKLFAAMLALTAIPGLAPGGDESSTSPASLNTPLPASQAASPGSPVISESAPRTGFVLDSNAGPNPGEPSALTERVGGPPSRFWVSGEYLLWWIRDSQLPPLITTSVPGATALPGVLGQPGTTVLFGGSDLDNQVRSGGRFTGGFWLNDTQTIGLEGNYFFLGSRSVRFDRNSSGAPGSEIIARPFFDVMSGIQNAQLVAFRGIASGDIHLSSSSRLQGAELNVLCNQCNTCCGCNYSVSLLSGFRYLQLDEGLGITESSHVNPTLPAGSPLFGGSTIAIADQFDTHNYFYGGQIGAQVESCWGRLFVDVLGKVALGATHEVVDIHGSTVITSPAGTTVGTPVGFLATASNSGQFTRDVFAVVPEIGINVGCQINTHLRASVGYTFLYWSSVARPGDQVDEGVSGTQLPTDTRFNPGSGPARPAVLLRGTDFWAQGINFGLEFRY
jgi:hypothetical protein